MAASGVSAEEREPVVKVASRLRTLEDYNLAARLQEEEFGVHYSMNRAERRQVGSDTRTSKVEQALEDRRAVAIREHQLRSIERTDEELARRLEEEMLREDRIAKERQAAADAELARRLHAVQDEERVASERQQAIADAELARRLQGVQVNDGHRQQRVDAETARHVQRREQQRQEQSRVNSEAADERLARELQERYNREASKRRRGRAPPMKASELIPMLIGFPKRNNGPSERQRERPRNVAPVAAPLAPIAVWDEPVDERTENELNSQMAGIEDVQPAHEEEPPPPYASLQPRSVSPSSRPRSHPPLATLATRDPPNTFPPISQFPQIPSNTSVIATPPLARETFPQETFARTVPQSFGDPQPGHVSFRGSTPMDVPTDLITSEAPVARGPLPPPPSDNFSSEQSFREVPGPSLPFSGLSPVSGAFPQPLIPQRSHVLPLPDPIALHPVSSIQTPQAAPSWDPYAARVPIPLSGQLTTSAVPLARPPPPPSSSSSVPPVLPEAGQSTMSTGRFHPTNPFLSDLPSSQRSSLSDDFPPPPPPSTQSTTVRGSSGFTFSNAVGLPPPSALALGNAS